MLILNCATVNDVVLNSATRIQDLSSRANALKSKMFYKTMRMGEKNHLAQRGGIEILGVDLPTVICELFLRGPQSAMGAAVRISLFVFTSIIVPTVIVPVLNFFASKKFSLPENMKKHFYNRFSDLVPEKSNEVSCEKFIASMKENESEESLQSNFHTKDGKLDFKAILDYKEKLLKAKSFVTRWDIQISGFLTYLVPWCQNWFEQKTLGLIGFSGEDKFLETSQKEESMEFHNRFKNVKLALGVLPTVFGSHYFSKAIEDSVRTKKEDLDKSKIKSFMKEHIEQFDYHKGIFANKLNLSGMIFVGGDAGMLLAARTIGEFTERIIRLSAFWPSFVYGIEWLHSKFAASSDKLNGTKLIDAIAPREFNIKKVRSLGDLEKDFEDALKRNDLNDAEVSLKSMENGPTAFTKAFFGNSLGLGVILNVIAYVFTRIRIARGIY